MYFNKFASPHWPKASRRAAAAFIRFSAAEGSRRKALGVRMVIQVTLLENIPT